MIENFKIISIVPRGHTPATSVSHVPPIHSAIVTINLYQEDGTATTSFVSEALHTVSPEKMTIEDEETFMLVAMQMYGGMPSSFVPLVMSDNMLV
jgi:hypothetical protein